MADGYIDEIHEQPAVISALAAAFKPDHASDVAAARPLLGSGEINKIVLTGMGGSLHGFYPTYLELSRKSAVPVSLWDCSELIQQAPGIIDGRTLLIAVSQSGESGELVEMCRSVTRPRVAIAVTNAGHNTLGDWADISVRTSAGPERTASTKTYTAGLASLTLVTSALLGEDVEAQSAALQTAADALSDNLAGWRAKGDEIVRFLGHEAPIPFIARGANLATAWMGALLTHEASKLACTSYSGAQFRHGPIELVREGFGCIVFESSVKSVAELDRRLVEAILGLGGRCVWVTAGRPRPQSHPNQLIIDMPDCDSSCLPLLNIVPVQLMQVPLALARGFEPAKFLNATKVTTVQ